MIKKFDVNKIYTNDPSFNEGSFCFCKENTIKIPEYPNKPLYFYFKDYFYIGSDITFFKNNFNTGFDIRGIVQLYLFGCNFYPYSIYKDIKSLMPGSVLKIKDKKEYSLDYCEIKKENKIKDPAIIISELDKILKKNVKNCKRKSYILYSGGLDSSIVMHYLRKNCNKIYAGSSVFSDDQLEDVQSGIKNFDDVQLQKLYADSKRFFKEFERLNLVTPIINPGLIDDNIHNKNAIKKGCENLLTGSGADEILADTIHFDFSKIEKNGLFFIENILNVDQSVKDIFGLELINEVINNSIEMYDFDIIDERLRFIKDSFLIPVQKMISENNSKKINRVEPFLSDDFYYLIKNTDFSLINTNKIEKYILRLFAQQLLPKDLYLKKSKDFDYFPEKNVGQEFYEYLKKNINVLQKNIGNHVIFENNIKKNICLKLSFLIKILEQF